MDLDELDEGRTTRQALSRSKHFRVGKEANFVVGGEEKLGRYRAETGCAI